MHDISYTTTSSGSGLATAQDSNQNAMGLMLEYAGLADTCEVRYASHIFIH